MSAPVADIMSDLLGEAIAATVSDAELYDGIEDPRVVRQLKAKVADGSVDRGLLVEAAEMRKASRAARSPRTAPSQIYFVGAEVTGLIKIGCASDPRARLRSLQTGSPDRLTLIATVRGGMDVERDLHRQFADARVHGEWFWQSEALVRFIEALS